MMETEEGIEGFQERWLKFSTVITVSDGDGMGKGLVLKRATFNLPNDHANSSACLNNRAIMENFGTCEV